MTNDLVNVQPGKIDMWEIRRMFRIERRQVGSSQKNCPSVVPLQKPMGQSAQFRRFRLRCPFPVKGDLAVRIVHPFEVIPVQRKVALFRDGSEDARLHDRPVAEHGNAARPGGCQSGGNDIQHADQGNPGNTRYLRYGDMRCDGGNGHDVAAGISQFVGQASEIDAKSIPVRRGDER